MTRLRAAGCVRTAGSCLQGRGSRWGGRVGVGRAGFGFSGVSRCGAVACSVRVWMKIRRALVRPPLSYRLPGV